MADGSNKKKIAHPGMVVAATIVVIALVVVICLTRKDAAEEEQAPIPVSNEGPKSTQALVEERMNDKEYRALLSACQAEQNEIARQTAVLQTEISDWIASHEKARDQLRKVEALEKGPGGEAEAAKAREELLAVMREDAEGKKLLERKEGLARSFEEARCKAADIVGARIRMQTFSEGKAR